MVFHQTTVEQYYTGELILSVGNFVSDGIPIIMFAVGTTIYFGNGWWIVPVSESIGIPINVRPG